MRFLALVLFLRISLCLAESKGFDPKGLWSRFFHIDEEKPIHNEDVGARLGPEPEQPSQDDYYDSEPTPESESSARISENSDDIADVQFEKLVKPGVKMGISAVANIVEQYSPSLAETLRANEAMVSDIAMFGLRVARKHFGQILECVQKCVYRNLRDSFLNAPANARQAVTRLFRMGEDTFSEFNELQRRKRTIAVDATVDADFSVQSLLNTFLSKSLLGYFFVAFFKKLSKFKNLVQYCINVLLNLFITKIGFFFPCLGNFLKRIWSVFSMTRKAGASMARNVKGALRRLEDSDEDSF